MNDRDLSELTFQIQENGADDPAVREALVRRFAVELFTLAIDLLPDNESASDEALGVAAETVRRALADPPRLREFDSIRNWLFATLAGVMHAAKRPAELLGKRIAPARRLALVLRYGHAASVDDIAEILGGFPDAAHRHLRRGRRQFAGLRRPPRIGHVAEAIAEAVDERITWNELPDPGHLDSCESCRDHLGALQEFGKTFTAALAARRPPAMRPDGIQAILDLLAGDGGRFRNQTRSLPVREAAWAAGAVAVFLLAFQALNPILSIDRKESQLTPTLQPSDPAESAFKPANYALLEERLSVWEAWLHWVPAGSISGTIPSTTEIYFSGSDHYAAFGSFDDVVLWDLRENVEIPLNGHESVVTALAFGGDRWLATGSEDGIVRVWDVATKRTQFVLEGGRRPVSALAFSPGLTTLAAGGNTGMTIWKFTLTGILEIQRLDGMAIRSIAFSPNGELFASIDRSGTVDIWSFPEFTHLFNFAARQQFNTGMAFSASGDRIATAAMEGTVKVFELSYLDREPVSAAHILTLTHPTWVSDVAWYGNEILMAISGSYEDSVANPGKRGVYFWEMASGLPAALPLFIESDGGILSLRQVGPNRLQLGSYNRAVHELTLQEAQIVQPLNAFSRSDTGLLPSSKTFPTVVQGLTLVDGFELQPAPDPIGIAYPLTFMVALEYVDYAQEFGPVMEEAIPDQFTPQGAAYDRVAGIATFAFTRTLTLNHDGWIYLRIRRLDQDNPFPFRDDWIGRSAPVGTVQIGRYLGETVTGEWLPAAVDGGVEGILRWTETPLTRFRWIQDGYLFEILSRSEIGTPATRWTTLFQPIALALISADRGADLIEYTVEDGDTCTGIADRFGTTVGRIVAINQLDADCSIYSGGTLQLPLPPAFGPMIAADFDCDGVVERLRSIPDPRQPNSALYMGFLLEDVPGSSGDTSGTDAPEFEYSPFWTYTIPDVGVDFFDEPILLNDNGGCPKLIGISGFGGDGNDSGLRVFSWNGDAMELLLASDGFLTNEFPGSNPLVLQTRSLVYDPGTSACTETIMNFERQGSGFVVKDQTVTNGVACFEGWP